MEIFFEETPPQKIAEAIGGYSEVKFGFGEVSEEALKRGGKSPKQVYPANTDERDPLTVPADDGAGEELPTGEPSNEAVPAEGESGDGAVPSAEGDNASTGEDVPSTQPIGEVDKNKDESNGPAVASGRKKSRKAPESIPQIDDIARRCTSYKQFAGAVAKWLELGKCESYFVDLAETAANVEKIAWTQIEEEVGKKGYKNPLSIRRRTSVDVTKKLTQMEIDCSFIALVEYVAKYKSFDFRPNIELRVRRILSAMGIEKEIPEIQKQLTSIAIEDVMAGPDKVNLRVICIAAGYKNEDDRLDAQMNFSSFANKFLTERGWEMMKAEEFIVKLRAAVYSGESIDSIF